MRTYMYTYMYVCIRICAYIHIYIYIRNYYKITYVRRLRTYTYVVHSYNVNIILCQHCAIFASVDQSKQNEVEAG